MVPTVMTEAQAHRSVALLTTRDSIVEFLSARDPQSEYVQSYANSKYVFHQREAKRLPVAVLAEIDIVDTDDFNEENPNTLGCFRVLRDVLERALKAELANIETELRDLGVKTGEET